MIEALKAKRAIKKIYIKKGEKRGAIHQIIDLAKQKNIEIQEIDDKVLQEKAKTRSHQGVIAVAHPKDYVSVQEILKFAREKNESPFIIVLNEITDPQNLGSIIRTAEGLSAHGIIIPKHRACGITPAVIKVSQGAAEHILIARVTNIADTLDKLKEEGLWVMGADGSGKDYFRANLTGPIALVIGGEDKGLGKRVKEKCDALIRIPMRGKITSLNAAIATAVLGYDILRQRIMQNDK